MDLTRKSILTAGCAVVLTSGLIILLVLLTAFPMSYFSISVQKLILILVFIFPLIVAMPLIFKKLNRLHDEKKILGWTFMGLGAEFILFPFMLLIYIFNFSSVFSIIIGGTIIIFSLIFGLSAGLISIITGISLVNRRKG
ncbi:MAG: hypothetical protein OIN84_17495 [Candidatus Methanoperedens sp.]|uniref:hypothetical protein n=1 Tax=Candidatus Methanoperedens sp. BLZ2 TaxID=2035255 RepID=UPI000BE45B04|nr:hypothetical protein [Candidatus Methanoperedens sp. BLZ2]KAB2944428.1 MAG: hypothetical protein F9K14_14570 [Candidatus Methanoperedens sp.]MBZ0174930.1 hypothetical protein [Candidatus Methanoperedens nitroreducens]MCX9079763.1 hypothetical protein [Candidatus Methanoperedens sp.]